jgi:hypothetical protein
VSSLLESSEALSSVSESSAELGGSAPGHLPSGPVPIPVVVT